MKATIRYKLDSKKVKQRLSDQGFNLKRILLALEINKNRLDYKWRVGFSVSELLDICDLLACSFEDVKE